MKNQPALEKYVKSCVHHGVAKPTRVGMSVGAFENLYEVNMSDYFADVQKYDSGADEAVVTKIVKHLGIALRNRDSSLVSCSDDTELARVREKWMTKKLGLTDDAKSDEIIQGVCETMKGAKSNKSRVTFYYLCAKEAGKLGDL